MSKTTRRFLGKTEDFASKQEQRFEQKHLKAYKKGYERFRYGYYEETDAFGRVTRIPAWHEVKQELIEG